VSTVSKIFPIFSARKKYFSNGSRTLAKAPRGFVVYGFSEAAHEGSR